MSVHTPGPWEIGVSGTDIYYPITPDSWVYVASASTRGASDNDEANARLIAAAPELAEALREAVAAYTALQHVYATDSDNASAVMVAMDRQKDAITVASNALAKAGVR